MFDSILAWITATVTAVLTAILPGYGEDPTPIYAGYIEAEYVYVAPSVTGRIKSLEAVEGREISQDQFLFNMDATQQEAALRAALARVAAADANLKNLETGGREAEFEVIRASLEEAKAQQVLAKSTLTRTENLFAREIVTQARVDKDRAVLEQSNAHVAQLRAQLEVAELPARDAQVVAARATLAAARAEADLARSRRDDMSVTAPVSGLIDKVFYETGEVAAVGSPVISILPPGEMRVLFFLPEPERASFTLGEELSLTCDGCPEGLTVEISRMASDPQYTPPIIYSRDERTRFVFRAEARLPSGTGLLPGQPITLERVE